MPKDIRLLLADERNEVFFSSISIWEVAIKSAQLGIPADLLDERARHNGLIPLHFDTRHARQVAKLPPHHFDPFDRALIAQALCEPLVLVSRDRWFAQYPVQLV